jgi:DNA-binding CsgD family transcriptional regulator
MHAALTPAEIDIFRSLKKTAIVLLLMLRLDRPAGETELAAVLSMNIETVRNHLRELSARQLVTRTERYQGWSLTGAGSQMILPMPETRELPAPATAEKPRSPAESALNMRIRRSATPISGGKPVDNSAQPSAAPDPDPAPADLPERLAILAGAGIGEPTRSRLAHLAHAEPAYLRAHCNRAKAERRGTGLLIHRIQMNDPAPRGYDDDRDRYVTGEFAHLVNH